LRAELDHSLAQALELPPRGGNWSHHYVCPVHGARLQKGRQLKPWAWEHRCPVGDHVLHGQTNKASLDFDGNVISGIHGANAGQALNCGLVYQVTGQNAYARRAKEMLLAYAEQYLKYPLHDNQGEKGRGGRVASQSLTEAGWLIEMTQAADLVWNSLTEQERQRLANNLLRPALDQVILPRRMGIHNIQCRHNSAIGLVGFLLADAALIRQAIEDPSNGFQEQLTNGVLDDGMWLEGSSGYHFYTIGGLWQLAEAARNCGLDLYGPKLRSMFVGPLKLAMPNYVLPNFNDSGTVPLGNQADYYELAWARYSDPQLAAVLRQSDRRGRLALLFGVSALPPLNQTDALTSRNSPASGYAILQSEPGQQATWLCLKYGPHGGGHGHPDKNTFILYARGEVLAPDAGTHAYGSSLHRDWDKTTFAHNTLVVDEQSQSPATGKYLAFGSENGVPFAMTDAGPIYDGVRFIRTAVMLNSRHLLFIDQVRADRARNFDIVYHQMGNWITNQSRLPPGKSWAPPASPGYNHFQNAIARTLAKSETITMPTQVSEGYSPALTLTAVDAPLEIICGFGILKTTEDRIPLLVQRQQGRTAVCVWAVSIDGSPVILKVSNLADLEGRPIAATDGLLVHARAESRDWWVTVNPEQKALVAKPAERAPFQVNSAVSIR
jgi:hypothetical protein